MTRGSDVKRESIFSMCVMVRVKTKTKKDAYEHLGEKTRKPTFAPDIAELLFQVEKIKIV